MFSQVANVRSCAGWKCAPLGETNKLVTIIFPSGARFNLTTLNTCATWTNDQVKFACRVPKWLTCSGPSGVQLEDKTEVQWRSQTLSQPASSERAASEPTVVRTGNDRGCTVSRCPHRPLLRPKHPCDTIPSHIETTKRTAKTCRKRNSEHRSSSNKLDTIVFHVAQAFGVLGRRVRHFERQSC